MTSIKGHFDGTGVVLDEPPPFALAVGQAVRVLVDAHANSPQSAPRGSVKNAFEQSFSPHAGSLAALMPGEQFDERDALHIDPIVAVPSDFVRRPGSGAGEIKIADDFDQTPDEFKEYL